MKQSKKSHTKRHIWFYEFERLWLLLTLLNLIALFFIIRGSTAPLIFDNDILRFCFIPLNLVTRHYIILQ